MQFALGLLIFLPFLTVIISIHELAHFGVARHYGMKVTEYFIGFGPRIWSTRRGELEWGVKALPIGGYVKIAGMNPYEEIAPEDVGPDVRREARLPAGAHDLRRSGIALRRGGDPVLADLLLLRRLPEHGAGGRTGGAVAERVHLAGAPTQGCSRAT